ncbi:hypothetical protein HK100_006576 [Physocladia obscura]|uniref:BTB domain-containing protein n=1 Tax=Physocladia obscura TaxID=109957 RepID=A0AAD5T7X1_9FUNG|nr:hypothetical protein HK100_006576 [Physocladia obscura]
MRVKLAEQERSVTLEIPDFPSLTQHRFNTLAGIGPVVSFGASPFLVWLLTLWQSSGRKWGLNVYPRGHDSRNPTSRIDVYVHVYAKDEKESESDFLAWVAAKKLHFNLTLTELPPQSLSVKYSSENHWSDMEDGAGWWYFTLEVATQLLELTEDILVVKLSFDEKGPAPPIPSPSSQPATMFSNKDRGGVLLNPIALMSRSQKSLLSNLIDPKEMYPLFPTAIYQPALDSLFDNPAFSDFQFSVGSQLIHVQKCFIVAKLTSWTPTTKDIEEISGIRYEVARSFFNFVYSGRLPMLEIRDSIDALALSELCVLGERYGERDLTRFLLRHLYAATTPANAITLIETLGGKSDSVQELLAFVICKSFSTVRCTSEFSNLIIGCVSGGTKEQRCLKTKRLLAILRRLETSDSSGLACNARNSVNNSSSNVSDNLSPGITTYFVPPRLNSFNSNNSSGNSTPEAAPISLTPVFDARRSRAFRTLLSTASVSDVKFVVDGREIFAQKCILSSLSDFFSAMFSGPWAESSETGITVIEIVDFPFNTFHAMLNYLYLEELDSEATLTDLGLLHVCADKYQILDLVALTSRLITTLMSPSNISANNESLYSLARAFFVHNFNSIKRTCEFINVVRQPWVYGRDAFVAVFNAVLAEIVVADFERVDTIPEESGGVDEFLDSSQDDEEEKLKNDERGLEKSDEKCSKIWVNTGHTHSADAVIDVQSPLSEYRSETDEFLDPLLVFDEDDLDPVVHCLDQELSKANLGVFK